MANNIHQRNEIYKNFESLTELPYSNVDVVIPKTNLQNSIKLNSYYNNLVDNDLYIDNRIHIDGQRQAGPKTSNSSFVREGENGYKSWVDYNGYPTITRKVNQDLSNSVVDEDTSKNVIYGLERYSESGILGFQDDKTIGSSSFNFDTKNTFTEIKDSDNNSVIILCNCSCKSIGTVYGTTNGLYTLKLDNNSKTFKFYHLQDNSRVDVANGKRVTSVAFRQYDTTIIYCIDNKEVYIGQWKNGSLNGIKKIYTVVNDERINKIEVLQNNEKQKIDNYTNIILLTNKGFIKVSDYGTILKDKNQFTFDTGKYTINCSLVYNDCLYIGTSNGLYKLDNSDLKYKKDTRFTSDIRQLAKTIDYTSGNDKDLFLLVKISSQYKIYNFDNSSTPLITNSNINGFGVCQDGLIVGTNTGISCIVDDKTINIDFEGELTGITTCKQLGTIDVDNESTLLYTCCTHNEAGVTKRDDVIIGDISYSSEVDDSKIRDKEIQTITNGTRNLIKIEDRIFCIDCYNNGILIINSVDSGHVTELYRTYNEQYVGYVEMLGVKYIVTTKNLYNIDNLSENIGLQGEYNDIIELISNDDITDFTELTLDDSEDEQYKYYAWRLSKKILVIGINDNKRLKLIQSIATNGDYIFEFNGRIRTFERRDDKYSMKSYGIAFDFLSMPIELGDDIHIKSINNAGKIWQTYEGEYDQQTLKDLRSITYVSQTNNNNVSAVIYTIDESGTENKNGYSITGINDIRFSYSNGENGANSNVFYTTDSSNNLNINYYIDTGYLSYDLIKNNGNISQSEIKKESLNIKSNYILDNGTEVIQEEPVYGEPSIRTLSEGLSVVVSEQTNNKVSLTSEVYVAITTGGVKKIQYIISRNAKRSLISYEIDEDYEAEPPEESELNNDTNLYQFIGELTGDYTVTKTITNVSQLNGTYTKLLKLNDILIGQKLDGIDYLIGTTKKSITIGDIKGVDVVGEQLHIYTSNSDIIYELDEDSELTKIDEKFYRVENSTDTYITGLFQNIYGENSQQYIYDAIAIFGEETPSDDEDELQYNVYIANKNFIEKKYEGISLIDLSKDTADNLITNKQKVVRVGDSTTYGFPTNNSVTFMNFDENVVSTIGTFNFNHIVNNIFISETPETGNINCYYTDGIKTYRYIINEETPAPVETEVVGAGFVTQMVFSDQTIGDEYDIVYYLNNQRLSRVQNSRMIDLVQSLSFKQSSYAEFNGKDFIGFLTPYKSTSIKYQLKDSTGGKNNYLITVDNGGSPVITTEKCEASEGYHIFYPGNAFGQQKMKYKGIFQYSNENKLKGFALQNNNRKIVNISSDDISQLLSLNKENIKWYDYYNGYYYIFFNNSYIRFTDYVSGIFFKESSYEFDAPNLIDITRYYDNNYLIIGRNSSNNTYLYNYTFEKSKYGELMDYAIEILSGDSTHVISAIENYDNYTFVSKGNEVLSSDDGFSLSRMLTVGSNSNTIKSIYTRNMNEMLFATSQGLYKTFYNYEIVYDNLPFTEISAIHLYNELSNEINTAINDKINKHINDLHKSGSIAQVLSDYSTTDFEINDNFTHVDSRTGTISNDYIEKILTGKTSDNPFRYVTAKAINTANGNTPMDIDCSYIAKCYKSGIVDMYIYLPTTYTYYIPHIPGSTNCIDSDNQQSVNGRQLTTNIHENYTTIRLGILSSYLYINDLYDNVIKGTSLPLKVKKESDSSLLIDENNSSLYFHSFMEPSVAKYVPSVSNISVENDQYQLEYYCFGTDAQSIKLTLKLKDNGKNYEKEHKCVYYHGNGLRSYNNNDTIAQIILEGEKKPIYNKNIFNVSEDIIFLGWNTKSNEVVPQYDINSTVSYKSSQNGDINLDDKKDIHLYAIWTKYDWEREGSTNLNLNLGTNKTATIAEVTVDKELKPNISNKVLVDWGQI